MKLSLFGQILGIIALTLDYTVTTQNISYAQTDKFFCSMNGGIPTTLVRTARGNIPMIRWVNASFPPPWVPRQRCEEISTRFQHFYNEGTLNFLRAGRLRGQPVLCVASTEGGPCVTDGVLVTFMPGTNPQDVLQQLLNYRSATGGQYIELSGSKKGGNRTSVRSISHAADTHRLVVSSGKSATYFHVTKFISQVEN